MASNEQRVALITGSGRQRVGSVIAADLARRGYRLALHYQSSADEANKFRDSLRTAGTQCEAYQADVSDDTQVEQLVSNAVRDFGRIDVLVTTASIWSPNSLEELTAEDLRRNFNVNALGTFLVARAVGRVMVDQSVGGSIVTIGDWVIDRPYLHHAPYLVSKGSIPTLTRVLALELGHRNPNVRVNCIHPGPVMLPPGTSEEEAEKLRQSTLVKDADCPGMIAHAVNFLIENRFVTGVCLPVDGGRHMYTPSDALR